jgi:hexosaminidase
MIYVSTILLVFSPLLARALVPFPLPTSITYGNETLEVSSTFNFVCDCDKEVCGSDIIRDAFVRYEEIVRPRRSSSSINSLIETMKVCIRTNDTALGPRTDETYELTISTSSVASANSIYGILHALESFSQVVDENNDFVVINTPLIIEDKPRFSYRGLMIDSGRHFLPVATIKRAIDGIHMNRMNVLHWHIVDMQSFPCGSDKYPQLAEKGAYSSNAVYSTSDMRDIVAYGKARGVRIMPEWDIPGHGSWGKGMPEIMGCDIVLDPTNMSTYDFLNTFFGEMMTIFEDEYVFLGGDEVDYTCWDANPKIASWLKKNNMSSYQLQQYFWAQVKERVLPVSLKGRTISIWENDKLQIDPKDLPNGTVANVYQSKSTGMFSLLRRTLTNAMIILPTSHS